MKILTISDFLDQEVIIKFIKLNQSIITKFYKIHHSIKPTYYS